MDDLAWREWAKKTMNTLTVKVTERDAAVERAERQLRDCRRELDTARREIAQLRSLVSA